MRVITGATCWPIVNESGQIVCPVIRERYDRLSHTFMGAAERVTSAEAYLRLVIRLEAAARGVEPADPLPRFELESRR